MTPQPKPPREWEVIDGMISVEAVDWCREKLAQAETELSRYRRERIDVTENLDALGVSYDEVAAERDAALSRVKELESAIESWKRDELINIDIQKDNTRYRAALDIAVSHITWLAEDSKKYKGTDAGMSAQRVLTGIRQALNPSPIGPQPDLNSGNYQVIVDRPNAPGIVGHDRRIFIQGGGQTADNQNQVDTDQNVGDK